MRKLLGVLRGVKDLLTGGQRPIKDWRAAQQYELNHAIEFMKQEHFQSLFAAFKRGEVSSATGYVNPLILREFFADDREHWNRFLAHIRGRTCLDIGPCVFSPLVCWDGIGRRIAIEPLGDEVKRWQVENLGSSTFDSVDLKAVGGDVYIPEFAKAIDGVVYCRNMLDHTPNWPFVLSNISCYATPGCCLMLWTDIDHRGTADAGHFDICSDVAAFRRLIEQFGFVIQREYQDVERHMLNWGCFAVKGKE